MGERQLQPQPGETLAEFIDRRARETQLDLAPLADPFISDEERVRRGMEYLGMLKGPEDKGEIKE